MESEAIIKLQNIGVRFGSLEVHRDISFSVQRGESITLLGPSGIGKTLILKIIIGLLQPSSGTVWVNGKDMNSVPERQLRLLRSKIGMLFQGAALFDSLSVYDNIAYSLRELGGKTEAEIRDVVQDRLEIVGLPEVANKFPAELSGGQKKRVGLARALAASPEIVLFDEPTTGLDPTAIRLIDDLIVKLNSEYNITAVSVTHDIESARRISERWLLINDGKVCADGPVETVAVENQHVMDFISGNWKSELHCI